MKKIKLTQEKIALIDDEDFDLISQYNWCYTEVKKGRGYAKTYRNGKIYMHRLLLNAQKGIQVDHINRDTLDNRRKNIRLVNQSQNNMNREKTNNKHGYKGIYFYDHEKYYKRKRKINLDINPWIARIKINKKAIALGYFPTKEKAALAYNEAAKKYFGQFARLNQV